MTRLAHFAACGALVWTAACSRSTDFERMRQQQRGNPYDASALFSDGMVMRVPPAGTIPAPPQAMTISAEGARREYQTFCATCHGADGSGQTVMAENMRDAGSPSLVSDDAVRRPDADLFDIISHGKNRMPAFDWAVPQAERSAVLAYVRTLQHSSRSAAGGSDQ